MNALVLKTNQIVTIVEKRGDVYIDTNYNPYKKEELEFFIEQNDRKQKTNDSENESKELYCIEYNGQSMSFDEWNILQLVNSKIEKAMFLASTVIEQHPDYTSRQVADYCLRIYSIFKDNIK